MDAAVNNLELECLVNALRQVVINPCIRRHLGATLTSRPVFGGSQETCSYASSPIVFRDEPAFHKTHRLLWVAAVRMGSQTGFEKSGEFAALSLRNEYGQGHGSVSFLYQQRCEFPGVFLRGGFRPQFFTKPG